MRKSSMSRDAWLLLPKSHSTQTSIWDRNKLSCLSHCWVSLVDQKIENQTGMQETWVQSLGWEDPLEKGISTHSSSLAWGILWREEPGKLQSMGSWGVEHNWVTSTFTLTSQCRMISAKTELLQACMLSHFSHVQLFVTPRTIVLQAHPSMGFPRQEYWSGLPFHSPGDLPDPRIEPGSPALQADYLPSEPPGTPY